MRESPVFALPPRLSIAEAADMHRLLSEASAQGGRLAIDGSCVTEIDTAGLQLLASLWQSGAAGAALCEWRSVSEPLIRSARLIGLDGPLGLAGIGAGTRADESP